MGERTPADDREDSRSVIRGYLVRGTPSKAVWPLRRHRTCPMRSGALRLGVTASADAGDFLRSVRELLASVLPD